jgi:hypothetical protein
MVQLLLFLFASDSIFRGEREDLYEAMWIPPECQPVPGKWLTKLIRLIWSRLLSLTLFLYDGKSELLSGQEAQPITSSVVLPLWRSSIGGYCLRLLNRRMPKKHWLFVRQTVA